MGPGLGDGLFGVGLEFGGDRGDDARAVLVEHVDRAVEEVAEPVGEFGVVPRAEAVVGPVAIGSDGEFADDVVTEGVEAPLVDDADGVDNVAGGLGELLSVLLPPAVGEHLLRERDSGGMEHDGPVDGVELDDVLADDVDVGRPEFGAVRGTRRVPIPERGGSGAVAEGHGDRVVIGEGVEPDVGHPFGGEGQGNAPAEAAGGTRDAQVFELLRAEEAEDLVASDGGGNEGRVGLDVGDEPVLVLGHAEVPVLLEQRDDLTPLRVPGAVRVAVLFGQEGFLADGVPTFVALLVDVALGMELGEDGGDDFLVTGLGGADEVVVGEAQLAGEGFPLHGETVAVGLRVLALGGGGLLDLLAMFIETGQEEDLVAEAAVGACDDIGQHHLVSVPEVCCAVRVENRRGQVKPFAHEAGTVPTGTGRGNGGGRFREAEERVTLPGGDGTCAARGHAA